MKKLLFYFKILSLMLIVNIGYAQSGTVKGKVTEANGDPLLGVSVKVKGSNVGSITNIDGDYSVTAGSGAILTFSYIGFKSQDVAVGSNSMINVTLEDDANSLSEVVVTALGIAREKKTLVYATQSIKPSELVEARDPNNIINSLSGKIANAQITQGSGGPGSGARIILRGNRSIQGTNTALIVVDGVPFNNSTNGTVGSDFGDVQGSDGASNINPDDVESLTVLRGASAAALYGSQAGNGVLVITTKKGKPGRTSVSINSGYTTESVTSLPLFQNTYGQTLTPAGDKVAPAGLSWGPKMTGQSVLNAAGKPSTYSPQPNNVSDFFRQGSSLNNSIGISGGSDKMLTYLSYGNVNQKGILDRNNLSRNNINLRISNDFSSKFSTDAKVTYVNQEIVNRARTGENNAPVINVYNLPRSLSTAEASDYEKTNNVGISEPTPFSSTLSSIYQNPYWTLNKMGTNESRDRVIGFISAKYKINSWLTLSGKANLDKTLDRGENYVALGTILWAKTGGDYAKGNITKTDRWFDAILEGNNDITKDLKVNYRVGTIFQDSQFDANFSYANGMNVTNKYSLNFAVAPSPSSNFSQVQTNSVFGQSNFSFKDAVFVDMSIRQDWTSTLPSPHSFLYPSIGVSTILSDLFKISDKITFLKASLNYAKVGNGASFALLNSVYNYGQGAGNGFLQIGSTLPLPGLKPEIVKNIEFGLEARFLQNKLGFTATYYKSNSFNQLLSVALPVATGFNNQYLNAGNIQNKGFEFVLTGSPLKNSDFKWDMTFNVAFNRNKVVELSEEVKTFYLGGGFGRSATPVVIEGSSYGDLLGFKWASTPSGKKIVDAKGLPVITKEQEYIGNFNPKATMGFTNTFDYKAFSLRVLVDGRVGGILVSGTEMNLAFNGIPKVTEDFREGNWDLGGVNDKGEAVTAKIKAQDFWQIASGGRYGNGEFFAYDATNFRVRELSAGYRIPVKSIKAINSAKISLVGRNLLFLYKGKSILDIPGIGKRRMPFDPDMALSNSNWQGVEYGTMPAIRSVGVNLQLTF
jgi:TonB-linked SusC/RagA family outer membrane protein